MHSQHTLGTSARLVGNKCVISLHHMSSGLIQLCPERDLVHTWEKDRDTMNSLQLCIGFAHRVQVTIATLKIWHRDDVISSCAMAPLTDEMVQCCSKFVKVQSTAAMQSFILMLSPIIANSYSGAGPSAAARGRGSSH